MKKILILGASGFIGSKLFKSVDRIPESNIMVLGHKNINHKRFERSDLITGDLEKFNLDHILRFKPDTIFHLARIQGKGRLGRYFASKRGRKGNLRLKSFLSENDIKTTLIYFSGTLLYGDNQEKTINEDFRLNPTSFSKQYQIAENPWYNSLGKENFNIIMLRSPWIVGNGSWFFSSYINFAINYGFVPLYGDGQNWMSLIDREDCCSLAIHLREKTTEDCTVNIYNPNLIVRQIDFVNEISKVLGVKIKNTNLSNFFWRDPALREAMSFSLKVNTIHTNLYEGFEFKTSDLGLLVKNNLPVD